MRYISHGLNNSNVYSIDVCSLKQHDVTLTVSYCFEKQNLMMHVNTSHKTAILVKLGHILQRKYPLVFPLMLDNCSVFLQPFILAELSPAATRCCSCSFGLQEAYMLLSGASVNHRVEAVGPPNPSVHLCLPDCSLCERERDREKVKESTNHFFVFS